MMKEGVTNSINLQGVIRHGNSPRISKKESAKDHEDAIAFFVLSYQWLRGKFRVMIVCYKMLHKR